MNKIACFGDSITTGTLVSAHKTWVSLLSKNLSDKAIVNGIGINGNTTRQALDRLSTDIYKFEYNFIIIQFGLNDLNRWETEKNFSRVDIDSFEANYMEIITKCSLAAKIHNIIICTNHAINGKQNLSQLNLKYNDRIRKLSFNQFIPVELIDREILCKGDILLADGIHLNENGHKQYFEQTYKKINDLWNIE